MTTPLIHISPDVRRRRITIHVDAPEDSSIHLQVEGQDVEYTGSPGSIKMDLPNCTEWSIEHPTLYTLTCTLNSENSPSTVTIPFGLRELTAKENRFYLNTKPLLVKAIQHGPDSSADPIQKAPFIKQELAFARDMGFNTIELSTSFPPTAYDEADKLGILIIQHLPTTWDNTLIHSLRNHPSIVLWNLGSTTRKRALELQQLDPGRIIFFTDETGSYYVKPFRADITPLDSFHAFQSAPLDTYTQLYLSHLGEPEQLSIADSCGYGGLYLHPSSPDPALLKSLEKEWGKRDLASTFTDPAALSKECQTFQAKTVESQLDALRNSTKIAGYSFHRLKDESAQDNMGLLNLKYETKPLANALKNINQQLRPLIHIHQHNLIPRQSTHVTVNMANELKVEGRAELSLQVVGPTNQVLWKKKRSIKIPKNGKLLWEGSIAASGSPGIHKFVVRVLKDMKRIAENSVEFYVYAPATPWNGAVNVLDPDGIWKDQYSPLVGELNLLAPIQIIPPLANTIRAYPDNELAQILGQVHQGATGLFFAPPEDWNDLAHIVDESLQVHPAPSISAKAGTVHYAKLHPIFESLPTRELMGSTYSNVIPSVTFLDPSDEDIAGSIQFNSDSEETDLIWGNDMLVKRYGNGRLIFTHLNIMENLGRDTVADILFTNLLKHNARRSLSGRGTLAVHQRSVEWIRNERKNHTHKWMVLGMFPNWGNTGMDIIYPPEETLDFQATYPGWYRALNWHSWFTTSHQKHTMTFTKALAPVHYDSPNADSGIAYAYAEVTCEHRCEVSLHLDTKNPVKLFVNGALHGDSITEALPETIPLKQGRNTLLIKIAKYRGDCSFQFDITPTEPAGAIKWWK